MGFPTKPFKSSFSVIEIILLKDKRFCQSQGRNARVLATLIYVVYHCSRTKRRVSTKGGKYFAISGIQLLHVAYLFSHAKRSAVRSGLPACQRARLSAKREMQRKLTDSA